MEISLSVNHISTLVVLVTDLSTAFDTVDHVALLKRLEWHGIRVIASIKIYDVLVTDLSTAFDTVYHVKFLKKSEWHGINVRTYSKITKTNIFVIEK